MRTVALSDQSNLSMCHEVPGPVLGKVSVSFVIIDPHPSKTFLRHPG